MGKWSHDTSRKTSRRQYLYGLIGVGGGAAGAAAYFGAFDDVDISKASPSQLTGPKTETEIGAAKPRRSMEFDQVSFYESGGAVLTLAGGHNGAHVALEHTDTTGGDPLASWQMPDGAGEITLRLGAIIGRRDTWSTRTFSFQAYASSDMLVQSGSAFRFAAPKQYFE